MKMRNKYHSLKTRALIWKKKLESVLRIVILPGFEGVPLYDVLVYFIRGFTQVNLIDRAAAVAFNVFISIFPMILFLFTLLPYMPMQDVTEMVLSTLQSVLPPGTYESAALTIKEIMSVQRGGLMSIGLLLAFYFSTTAVSSFIRGFNMGDTEFGKISFLKEQIYSIVIMLMFVGLLLLSVVLMIVGEKLIPILFDMVNLEDRSFTLFMLNILRWLIIVLTLVVAISMLYHVGNPRSKRFKLFTPGTLLFTGMFIVGTVAFNYYISNISTYNILYGSIGGLLIFLIWIFFNCILVLIGYELNKSIAKAQEIVSPKLLTDSKNSKEEK